MTSSRGIRNNNPLNIRYNSKNKWQGRIPAAQKRDREFEEFTDPKWGIRAGAVLIINHFDKRNANTIRKLIDIWAPSNENDTEMYISTVSRLTGFNPDDELNFHTWAHLSPVIKAMIKVENGVQPYPDRVIDEGLKLAGVVRSKPLSLTDVVRTDTGKATIATSSAIATIVTTTAPALSQLDWRVALAIVIVATVSIALGALVWRARRG